MLINPGTLTMIRTVANSALPDSAKTLRESQVTDSRGGWTTTYTAIGSSYPCQYTIAKDIAQTDFQLREHLIYRIAVPLDTDIQTSDRIQITNSRTEDTLTLAVISVDQDESYDVLKRLTAEEI